MLEAVVVVDPTTHRRPDGREREVLTHPMSRPASLATIRAQVIASDLRKPSTICSAVRIPRFRL